MEIKDIVGKAIGVASPFIEALTPGGKLITTGIKLLANAFGISPDEVTPEKMQELVEQDRDFSFKVKQAELNFIIEQQKNQIEIIKEELKDVQDARARDIATKDNVNKILAYTIISSFIAVVGATLLGYAKVESALAGTLVGYMSAKTEQIIAFYFGSSRSSKEKTEMIYNSTPNRKS